MKMNDEVTAFRAFLRRHQVIRTGIYITGTVIATIVTMSYTNSYNDHVEKQKEFIVLQNMQEDFTEMKTLLKTNNDMMASLMQDNVANKTLTGQLDVRTTNVEDRMLNVEERMTTMERVIYAPKK